MEAALQLSSEILNAMACPWCKASFKTHMKVLSEQLVCFECGGKYPITPNGVVDMRCLPPQYTVSPFQRYWVDGQKEFEIYATLSARQDLSFYLKQIKDSEEIYVQFLHLERIQGLVLDVGGSNGRLARWVSNVQKYISLDPFLTAKEDLTTEDQLVAYPHLKEKCNFIGGRAELLPFLSSSFEFIRCNSVIDQVWDPYAAFREMFRVLIFGGRLFLGVSTQNPSPINSMLKRRASLVVSSVKRIAQKLSPLYPSFHLWRPSRANIIDLAADVGFEIIKEMTLLDGTYLCLLMTKKG